MTWQIKDVGWPIPISNNTWPITNSVKHKIEATPYMQAPPVETYGSSYYYSDSKKGSVINEWS